MSNTPLVWYDGILEHYGTLDKFEDLPTLRHMLESTKKWLDDDAHTLISFEDTPETFDRWLEEHAEERKAYRALGAEIGNWFHRRGLRP